jgi:hypothetical protein
MKRAIADEARGGAEIDGGAVGGASETSITPYGGVLRGVAPRSRT